MPDLLDVIREAKALEPAWQLEAEGPVRALAPSPHGATVAAALVDGPIVLFDASSGARLATLSGHAGATAHVEWHPDDALLLSCGHDGTFALWRPDKPGEVARRDVGEAWCSRATFSPDGNRIVTAARKRVCTWSVSGEPLNRWPERTSTVLDVRWRPQMLQFHESPVTVLAYQGDGDLLASAAEDGTLAVWAPRRNQSPLAVRGPDAGVNALAWVDGEQALLVGRRDGTIAKYRIV